MLLAIQGLGPMTATVLAVLTATVVHPITTAHGFGPHAGADLSRMCACACGNTCGNTCGNMWGLYVYARACVCVCLCVCVCVCVCMRACAAIAEAAFFCSSPITETIPYFSQTISVMEAENFTVAADAGAGVWEPRAWAHSPGYFAANQANAFMSRRAYLHADANVSSGSASAFVRIAQAGTYNVLLRYEALYRFETPVNYFKYTKQRRESPRCQ